MNDSNEQKPAGYGHDKKGAAGGAAKNEGRVHVAHKAPMQGVPDRGDKPAASMLYVTNQDKPGFIGRFATLLAEAGINIATFHLGRDSQGGNAIALVEVDGSVPVEVLAKVRQIPNVQQVKPLQF
jgi:L-serine deaminase